LREFKDVSVDTSIETTPAGKARPASSPSQSTERTHTRRKVHTQGLENKKQATLRIK